MATVNVRDARNHFSALVERASAGERIIIARAGKPVAVLGPIVPASKERKPGLLKGRVRFKRHFDSPMPKAVLDAFGLGSGEPE